MAQRGWMPASEYHDWSWGKDRNYQPPAKKEEHNKPSNDDDGPSPAKKSKEDEQNPPIRNEKPMIPYTKTIVSDKDTEMLAFDSGFCPFANHHRTPFTVDGTKYLSVFQYVESKKAEYLWRQ